MEVHGKEQNIYDGLTKGRKTHGVSIMATGFVDSEMCVGDLTANRGIWVKWGNSLITQYLNPGYI